MARWLIPEAAPLACAVGGALSMMVYTGVRSCYSSGAVSLTKADREHFKVSEEYAVNDAWGLASNRSSLLRRAGEWWGSSNVFPNDYMLKNVFKPDA